VLFPELVNDYEGQDWRSFFAMPGPLLNAFIDRRFAVRAQRMLDMSEAVYYGMLGFHGGEGYGAWRARLERLIHGEAPVATANGKPESFLAIKARREAGRAERERQRRLAAEA
jgi:hypothetical protein